MRPLADQTILVTGATDGLGRALAAELAGGGATVIVHGRDETRGRETVEAIGRSSGSDRLHSECADLASLHETAALAERVAARHERLDALVNNAGIGTTGEGGRRRELSRDGHELRFAVNYLAGYLLTRRLLDLLRASAPARIVNVASAGQYPIDFDDVMLERDYDARRAYAQSKLAQICFTLDLADELRAGEVTANCLHPATFMPTKMVLAAGLEPASSLQDGTRATLRLVADPGLDGTSGVYFDGLSPATPHPQAHDVQARRRLRALSDELCGL